VRSFYPRRSVDAPLAGGQTEDERLHFTDVTDASGIDQRGYGMGAATGDFDNDGCVDLYLTSLGSNNRWQWWNEAADVWQAMAGIGRCRVALEPVIDRASAAQNAIDVSGDRGAILRAGKAMATEIIGDDVVSRGAAFADRAQETDRRLDTCARCHEKDL